MPSRYLLPSPVNPPAASAHRRNAFLLLIAVTSASLLLLMLLVLVLFLYLRRRLSRSPTSSATLASSTADSVRLRRFSYRALRSSTDSFDPSRSLGRGASSAVFRGTLRDGKFIAVKRLLFPDDFSASPPFRCPSASSERVFENELHVLAALPRSPFVVSLLGYCIQGKRRRLLVYEYMANGSLQEAIFGSRLPSTVLTWERRFAIILDVASALSFLHVECDPPVIHGDIKPSNVLLDADFRAKVSDFGLSRVKSDPEIRPEVFSYDHRCSSRETSDSRKVVDFAFPLHGASSSPNSPKNFDSIINLNSSTSANGKEEEEAVAAAATSDVPKDDNFSIEQSTELSTNSVLEDGRVEPIGDFKGEMWWKQEEDGEVCSKDYVKEWIGNQICLPANPDWQDGRRKSNSSSPIEDLDATAHHSIFKDAIGDKIKEEDKCGKRENIAAAAAHKKDRKMREWWKEKYFAEISQKGLQLKKDRKWYRTISSNGGEESSSDKPVPNSSIDVSLRKSSRKRSEAFTNGDVPNRELSNTTSMRGTVCYAAPECHGGEHCREEADIYSFGVLMLVIVSGRRPLHLQYSSSLPVRLEKANLVNWCKQLAHTGDTLELVDEKLKGSYNKDQASLCINLALLCLQRAPELRPDSCNVVKILRGEMEPPVLFLPSKG